MLSQRFDVHSSLQVKPRSMFNCFAFSFDLRNHDHVKPFALLISFRFKLSRIRGILLNLIDDHVKHGFEHVKLRRDHVKLQLEPSAFRRAQVVLSREHNRTERSSAESISFLSRFGEIDPALPRSVLCLSGV